MRRFAACQEKYVWTVSLPFPARDIEDDEKSYFGGAEPTDTVCTVSALTDCDALAVYNFSGETFSCRLTGGRKDKFKPLKSIHFGSQNLEELELVSLKFTARFARKKEKRTGEDMQSA